MSVISEKTNKLLTLSLVKGIGTSALKRVAVLEDLGRLTRERLLTHAPWLSKSLGNDSVWNEAAEQAEKQIDEARRTNARILSPLDSEYPPLLSSTKDNPFIIFVKGKLPSVPEKSVAVIGTREPTAHGILIAQRITQFFVEKGWSVVSGLAIGCDAIAHQATIDLNGHTVGVLAHGLHTIAPSRHRRLADAILESGGALLTEFPFGQNPHPQQFVKRDRTQAGMARGVVMIQSDVKGGSLHASRASLSYQRWLAVPYPTNQDKGKCEPKVNANLLLADGGEGEKKELLQCLPSALNRVIILRSKEDYAKMLNDITSTDPAQTCLI